MICNQCVGIEAQFNDKVARRELRKYRRRGRKPQTQMLISELRSFGIRGRTLLDIGGGIGSIQHALAEEGAGQITSVDASPAFLEVARKEAENRGYADRAVYKSGNFADIATEVEQADFVTLDRVVCCYHDLDALLRPAAERARVVLALVFPRENWGMKIGAKLANLVLRLGGSDFRTFVHPHRTIEAIAVQAGLRPATSAKKGLWRVVTFVRISSKSGE